MSCRLLGRCNEWARRTRCVWRCQSIRAPVGALCLDTGYTSTIRLGKGCQLTRTWTVRPGAGLNHQFSYMSSGRSASYSRSEETLRCGKLPPEGIPITPSMVPITFGWPVTRPEQVALMQISALPEMTQTLLPLRALFHHQTRLITGLALRASVSLGGRCRSSARTLQAVRSDL